MEPRRLEAWSLPDDPDGFRALLELPFLAGTGWQDPNDTPGKGTVVLPADYADLDTLLHADPTDVANARSCLICAFREGSDDSEEPDSQIPDFEFFADQRTDPIGDGSTSIIGPDIRSGLNDGKIFPRTPDDPIWLWGQKTVTKNSDLTEGTIADEEFEIWIIGAGGTWRIDLGATGWSAAIDDAATNADVKTAIEAGPSSVVEANVTGSGTVDSPWHIHIVDPAQVDYSVQVDDASLTGDIFVRFLTDGGDVRPTYYTPAQTIGGVLFGVMGTFRVEIDPLDGLPSILVAGNSPFIGAQQILQGVQGLQGYADVQIRPLIYGDRFRIGVRDIDEGWLYTVEADLVTGSYQTITIPFPMVLDFDQVILRAAGIGDNPPDFYIRNLNLYPGMPGTDFGDITSQLMTAIQARGVLTWLDLTLVTPGVDSNLVAWDNDSLAWRADPGMDMGTHILGQDGKKAGYEYDVVRLPPPYTVGNPTHQLLIYNRLGRGETPLTDPAVIVGDLDSGQLAKRRIAFTHLLVEYAFPPKFTEVTHVDFAAMPRREGYLRAEQALDETTAIQIGETYLLDQVDDLLATQVRPTSIDPYRDLDVGWQIPYELGSYAGRHTRRVHTISARFDDPDWTGEITASHLFTTERAAEWEAIRRLQEAFDRRNRAREAQPIVPQLGGCCPSCPARVSGFITGTMGVNQTLDWNISRDPDEILVGTAGSGLAIRRPGLYTVHLNMEFRWTLTAGGGTNWKVSSTVAGNDAGQANQTVEGSRPTAGVIQIHSNLFHFAHTAVVNQEYNAFWGLFSQTPASIVNTSTGMSLVTCDLTIVRLSGGCAELQGST